MDIIAVQTEQALYVQQHARLVEVVELIVEVAANYERGIEIVGTARIVMEDVGVRLGWPEERGPDVIVPFHHIVKVFKRKEEVSLTGRRWQMTALRSSRQLSHDYPKR